ncbi:type VI secretion system Vgr family protein [Ramlibacter sp.]|uniref:type VI secretion system Vgr family protein n=1 Tax=Ramlibacter sp. TaxID=1917967 RepID=UPI003D0B676C
MALQTGFKQDSRLMTLTTPFGTDDLLLDAVEGSEGISEMFKFHLHMRSGSTALAAATIVGKPVTVKLAITDGPERYINGICSRFVHSGFDRDFANYDCEIVPKLWLLTLSRGRKIYQAKTIPEIVKAVLGTFSVTVDDSKVSGSYTALDYVVQYDETAFDFISRLMEQAGIFYWFKFASGAHTMMLGDSASAFTDIPDSASIRFFPGNGLQNSVDTVTSFAREHTVVLKKATVNDYNFETPSTSLEGTHSASAGETETYEFGVGHTAAAGGTAIAKLRVEASQIAAEVLRGDSFAYAFTAGGKFTLKDHFVAALNAAHVLRRVHHTARDDMYTNSFEAFPAATPFRPPVLTSRPRVAGCETALVVGSSGEEIWTDKHGRIKVLFPWDKDGKKDDKASCWIRVAQSVADKTFGAMFLPRVGQEVVITYINGDPERPLVTGAVYNAENAPPATLPDNQTQTIIRTRSSKSGTAGNELRFEDKKDSEELYMHAQKDMKVEIENALTTQVKKGAETHTVDEGDRTIEVKKGKETHKVKTTRLVEVEGDETHTNKANYNQTVTKNHVLKIDGDLTIEVGGKVTFKSTGAMNIESSAAVTVKSGAAMTLDSGAALDAKSKMDMTLDSTMNANIKAKMNVVAEGTIQADVKAPIINVKASGMGTVEAGGILTLKGAMTKVN